MTGGTPEQLAAWLDEGIAAALGGEKKRACDLLLRVVNADEKVEEAWLWLSRVVDNPSDRLIALENVLALNPGNALAKAGVQRLLSEHPELVAGEAAPALSIPPAQDDVPGWLREPPAAPQPPAVPQDDVPSWLREAPAVPQEDVPGWLQDLHAVPTPQDAEPAPPAVRLPARPVRDVSARRPEGITPVGKILYPDGAAAPTLETAAAGSAAPQPAAAQSVIAVVPGISEIEKIEAEQLRCPYCARPTEQADKRCPSCGKSLMIKSRLYEQASGNLSWIVLLLIVSAGRGLLDLGLPFVALYMTASWFPPRGPTWGSWPLPGAYPNNPAMNALILVYWVTIGVVAARTVLYLLVAWGLSARISLFFYLVLVVTIGDVVFGLWNLVNMGFDFTNMLNAVGGGFTFFGFAINLAMLWLVAGAWTDFESRAERILCRIDRDAKDAAEQFRRGHLYRKHGMWGLAAVHYGAALGGMPDSLEFAKNYAISLSQTGRDQEALDLLRERQARNATDLQLPQMIELLEQKIAKKNR